MNGCQDEGNRLGVCNNMQFSNRTNSHCSGITSYDEYYVGFRIGCTSTGNTIDVCENATVE
jgi:hypothetical protein